MNQPIIVLNFKTYLEGTGKNAVSIAQACKDVADETGA
ncbi:MAG: triose-phosphate isomerase, partial [ANME-2 cluster archaeon]